jgi:hypothetical protein
MTHARGATRTGHELDDVRTLESFHRAAYQWDRIKILAKRKPYVETRAKNAPDNNANTLAYFGLGKEFPIVLYKVHLG